MESNALTCLSMVGPSAFGAQGDICSVHYTVDVQYTGSIEHAQSSLTSSAELPTCPVCLGKYFEIGFKKGKNQADINFIDTNRYCF